MYKQNESHKYDDIINLPHHTSSTRPRMSMEARAAQFSPFAALSGHGEAVKEAERVTENYREIDEDEKTELDIRLQLLQKHLKKNLEITLTYFQPDAKKAGGAYVTTSGVIKKIDEYSKFVIMFDGTEIPIKDITNIRGEIFRLIEENII